MDDLAAAEKLLRRALAGAEFVLGAHHPDTVTYRNNLAIILGKMGRAGENTASADRTPAQWSLGGIQPAVSYTLNSSAFTLDLDNRD